MEDANPSTQGFDWGTFYGSEIPTPIDADIESREEALLREMEFREGRRLVPNSFWMQRILLGRTIQEENALEALTKSTVQKVRACIEANSKELRGLEDVMMDDEEIVAHARQVVNPSEDYSRDDHNPGK